MHLSCLCPENTEAPGHFGILSLRTDGSCLSITEKEKETFWFIGEIFALICWNLMRTGIPCRSSCTDSIRRSIKQKEYYE